jgi:hypothetical protein
MLGRRGDGQNQTGGQPSAPASNEDDDLPF